VIRGEASDWTAAPGAFREYGIADDEAAEVGLRAAARSGS
jgi:hypothetical protein